MNNQPATNMIRSREGELQGALPDLQIRDLGLLSDRRTSALVTPLGEIVWYCPARFDAPSLFARLLDEQRGGSWRIDLPHSVPAGRRYLSDSAILESRLQVSDDELVITDFLPFGEGIPRGLCRVFSRAPRPYQLLLHAAPDYARRSAVLMREGNAVRVDACVWLYASHPLQLEGQAVVLCVPQDEPAWAFLSDQRLEHVDWELVSRWKAHTLEAWEGVTTHATYHGPYEEAVRASLRALRMLTHHDSGGTIAAPPPAFPKCRAGRSTGITGTCGCGTQRWWSAP
ncbi:trehalase-like domain-containing protein [Deinococcus peraridilitoris]|uniref:trehalase-like domain-containing protein n=1 Tax=Deinococcus peraridilitoris TaxID=432329 RepID=UPI0003073B97|nr:trehalase-like domain-containing protein [Deinococcus peraridilitoris]